jgi:hypothetical protein
MTSQTTSGLLVLLHYIHTSSRSTEAFRHLAQHNILQIYDHKQIQWKKQILFHTGSAAPRKPITICIDVNTRALLWRKKEEVLAVVVVVVVEVEEVEEEVQE